MLFTEYRREKNAKMNKIKKFFVNNIQIHKLFRMVRSQKMWNASRFCVSSLRRGHANLLCIVPILVYVLPKQVH